MILFDDIPHHEKEKAQILQAFKDGRNSHAQLFYGAKGNGKLAVALAYIATLLCQQPGEKGACGSCASCRQMMKLTHPDVQFVFPNYTSKEEDKSGLSEEFLTEWRDALKENIYLSKEDWSTTLRAEKKNMEIRVSDAKSINQNLSFKSFYAGYKVVLIWLPEFLTVSAANKLLKNIEEPESKTLILMVSEQFHNLMPTITSRLQSVHFPRLSNEEVKHALKARNIDGAEVISDLVEGNLNDALQLAHKSESLAQLATYFTRWMRICYAVNMPEILKLAEETHKEGRVFSVAFLRFSLQTIRQTILSKYKPSVDNPLFQHTDFKMANFAKVIHPENAHQLLSEIDEAISDIERYCSIKMVITDLSIRVHYLLKRGEIPQAFKVL